MVKVKITRDCFIKGKHYGVDEIAEVCERDAFILTGIDKAVAYDGAMPKIEKKKGRK
jgi:hypothetical protein|tara:strand:- start:80 stop:250 length:171 start_codon:yes stop_codon:yes gene_type:complete